MGIKRALATQMGNVEGEREVDRLFEAAEWLRSTKAFEEAHGDPLPALRALVVDLGVGSPLTHDNLRDFTARFPGIAVVAHHRSTSALQAQRQSLAESIDAFSHSRRLSPRQRSILKLHLGGKNDKEIAASLGSELTTVHEHWRRMGRKSQGSGKIDSIADFHRYLARDFLMTNDE